MTTAFVRSVSLTKYLKVVGPRRLTPSCSSSSGDRRWKGTVASFSEEVNALVSRLLDASGGECVVVYTMAADESVGWSQDRTAFVCHQQSSKANVPFTKNIIICM